MSWETVAERIIAHVAEAKMHLLLAAHMRPGETLVNEIAMIQRSIDGAQPYIDELGDIEKLPKPVLLEWLVVTKGVVMLRERHERKPWTPQTLIVEDVTHVKERGTVIIVTLRGPEPPRLTKIVRQSDGVFWFVSAVEWFAIGRRPGRSDTVGLLLHVRTRRSDGVNPDPDPERGDVVCLQENIP